MSVREHRRCLSMLLLATLLLRASIPDGYMPAPLAAGMPFVLCPSGIPAGFMAMPGGPDHHHGHGGDAGAGVDASQCPIGHMLTPAMACSDHWQAFAVALPPEYAAAPLTTYTSATPIKPRSRGPPA